MCTNYSMSELENRVPFMCQEATNPPTDTAFQKILSSLEKKGLCPNVG